MSSVAQNEAASGYPVEPLLLELGSDTSCVCAICQMVMCNPTSACSAGHAACEKCLFVWCVRSSSHDGAALCPCCCEEIDPSGFTPANEIRERIDKMHSRCDSFGCHWAGTISELNAHRAVCQQRLLSCPLGCGLSDTAGRMRDHEKVCERRLLLCCACGGSVRSNRAVDHLTVCPMVPMPCPLGCGKTVARQELLAHKNVCPRAPVSCVFAHQGCPARMLRSELPKHCADNVQYHASLLAKREKSVLSAAAKRERELMDEIRAAKRARTDLERQLEEARSGSPTPAVHNALEESAAFEDDAAVESPLEQRGHGDPRLAQLEVLLSHDEWEPVAGREALWEEVRVLRLGHRIRILAPIPCGGWRMGICVILGLRRIPFKGFQSAYPSTRSRTCAPICRFSVLRAHRRRRGYQGVLDSVRDRGTRDGAALPRRAFLVRLRLRARGRPLDLLGVRRHFLLPFVLSKGRGAATLAALESELSHAEWELVDDDDWQFALWERLAALLRAEPSLRTILSIPEAHAYPEACQSECMLDVARGSGPVPLLKHFVDHVDGGGSTPLHHAAAAGDARLLAALLADASARGSRNKVRGVLRHTDAEGNTPLHLAAEVGSAICMSLLLEARADPNFATSAVEDGVSFAGPPDRLPPLRVVADTACARLLLAAGACGGSALFDAARAGCADSVATLLDAGVSALSPGPSGCTPLCAAAGAGHAVVVAALLGAAEDADVLGAASDELVKALQVSVRGNHFAALKLLLDDGRVSLDRSKMSGGVPVLRQAREAGACQCALMLMEAGAIDEDAQGFNLLSGDELIEIVRWIGANAAFPFALSCREARDAVHAFLPKQRKSGSPLFTSLHAMCAL